MVFLFVLPAKSFSLFVAALRIITTNLRFCQFAIRMPSCGEAFKITFFVPKIFSDCGSSFPNSLNSLFPMSNIWKETSSVIRTQHCSNLKSFFLLRDVHFALFKLKKIPVNFLLLSQINSKREKETIKIKVIFILYSV